VIAVTPIPENPFRIVKRAKVNDATDRQTLEREIVAAITACYRDSYAALKTREKSAILNKNATQWNEWIAFANFVFDASIAANLLCTKRHLTIVTDGVGTYSSDDDAIKKSKCPLSLMVVLTRSLNPPFPFGRVPSVDALDTLLMRYRGYCLDERDLVDFE
jgi:hypothetical protein